MFGRRVMGCGLVGLGLLLAGCGDNASEASAKKELVVLCGSSFVPPTDELIAKFKAGHDVEVVTTAAGSEDFLPQVKIGEKGDILVTHDPYLEYVDEAGKLAGSAHVGFVAPVLAVQKGNPKGLASIQDLTQEGLKVALPNPDYSTCGEMVEKLLSDKGIKDAVMKNVENRLTKGHSQLGTFLKTKAVDAVIMWNGVANTFRDDLDVVKTPYEYDEEIRVHVIGLNYSANPELVEAFIEFAKQNGTQVYGDHGYVK